MQFISKLLSSSLEALSVLFFGIIGLRDSAQVSFFHPPSRLCLSFSLEQSAYKTLLRLSSFILPRGSVCPFLWNNRITRLAFKDHRSTSKPGPGSQIRGSLIKDHRSKDHRSKDHEDQRITRIKGSQDQRITRIKGSQDQRITKIKGSRRSKDHKDQRITQS